MHLNLLAHFSLLSRQKVNRTTVDSQVVLQCVGALRLVDASNNGNDYDGIGGAWSVVDDFSEFGSSFGQCKSKSEGKHTACWLLGSLGRAIFAERAKLFLSRHLNSDVE